MYGKLKKLPFEPKDARFSHTMLMKRIIQVIILLNNKPCYNDNKPRCQRKINLMNVTYLLNREMGLQTTTDMENTGT